MIEETLDEDQEVFFEKFISESEVNSNYSNELTDSQTEESYDFEVNQVNNELGSSEKELNKSIDGSKECHDENNESYDERNENLERCHYETDHESEHNNSDHEYAEDKIESKKKTPRIKPADIDSIEKLTDVLSLLLLTNESIVNTVTEIKEMITKEKHEYKVMDDWKFPLKTIQDLNRLDQKLGTDPKFGDQLVQYLAAKGIDPNVKSHSRNVKNVGCLIIAKEVQVKFSLRGKGEKDSFDVYSNVVKLIYNVMVVARKTKSIPSASEQEINTAIGNFLKHAPARTK
ncbi:hypothetical protein ACFFRR_007280 [Megaselia abdita]